MTDSTISSNGGSRYQSGKVRVAIIGVGNCASSLVQGVEHYKDADPKGSVPGLMHVDLGGYHISDIEFSAAFDIDADKVGKDLSEAIWAGQNNTIKFADVPNLGVKVHRGRPTWSSPTCRSAPRRRPSGTSRRSSRPAAAS
jgi:myo-inositol-1-phosphate synthase